MLTKLIVVIILQRIGQSVQSLSRVRLCATPWTAALQAFLSFTISQSLLKLMSIESVMPSNHLIPCHPLLLLPSIFPSIRVFSNELAICFRYNSNSSRIVICITNEPVDLGVWKYFIGDETCFCILLASSLSSLCSFLCSYIDIISERLVHLICIHGIGKLFLFP